MIGILDSELRNIKLQMQPSHEGVCDLGTALTFLGLSTLITSSNAKLSIREKHPRSTMNSMADTGSLSTPLRAFGLPEVREMLPWSIPTRKKKKKTLLGLKRPIPKQELSQLFPLGSQSARIQAGEGSR